MKSISSEDVSHILEVEKEADSSLKRRKGSADKPFDANKTIKRLRLYVVSRFSHCKLENQ